MSEKNKEIKKQDNKIQKPNHETTNLDNGVKEKKVKKKAPVIMGVAVLIIAAIGLVVYGVTKNLSGDADSIYDKNAIDSSMAKSFNDTIKTLISVKGTVNLQDNYIIYPSTSGIVSQFDLEVGDEVTVGDILLSYKDDHLKTLENGLKDADLAIRSATAGYQATYSPVEASEVERADAEIKSAENKVAMTKLAISQGEDGVTQAERKLSDADYDLRKSKLLLDAGALSKADYEKMQRGIKDLEDMLQTQTENVQKLTDDLVLATDGVNIANTSKRTMLNRNNTQSASNQRSISQVQIDQARFAKEKVLEDIDELVLEEKSPITGTILKVMVEMGATVNQASPIFEIADLSSDNLVIKSNIPERDATGIVVGQSVDIRMGDVRDTVYEGKVVKVNPVAERLQTGSNTYETMVPIEVSIVSADTILKSGYTVDIDITTRVDENAIMVPLSATTIDEDSNQYVFIVDESNYQVRKQMIIPLSYSGEAIEVEGVALDVWVVTNPSPEIKDGSFIKPIGGN